MEPTEIAEGDQITFDHDELGDCAFDVTDTDEKDMGIASVFAAGLVVGCERYSLTWAEGSDDAHLQNLDTDDEWRVAIDSIVTD